MALDPGVVDDLAHAALDALVAGWPGGEEALPERQYVTNGTVVWDCPQLVVMVDASFGTTADIATEEIVPRHPLAGVRSVSMAAVLLRCFPDMDDEGTPPPAADLDAASSIIFRDSILMLNTLAAAQKAGELGSCQGFAFERWTSESPSGGLAGGSLRFRLMLL